jgi:hypothetical protein
MFCGTQTFMSHSKHLGDLRTNVRTLSKDIFVHEDTLTSRGTGYVHSARDVTGFKCNLNEERTPHNRRTQDSPLHLLRPLPTTPQTTHPC